MTQENTTNAQTQEQPAVNTGAGVQPEASSIVDRADLIAKRIEEGNKKFEELVARQERTAAQMMLGGRAQAGTPAKTDEQILQENIAARALALQKAAGY